MKIRGRWSGEFLSKGSRRVLRRWGYCGGRVRILGIIRVEEQGEMV